MIEEFTKNKWTKKDYEKFLKYLHSISDTKYKSFHSKIVKNDNVSFIGIKTPVLRKIAFEISKGNYQEFLKYNTHQFYEETVIHGLIIGYLKEDFKVVINLFKEFLKYIDNWATCDIVCSNMKIFKQYPVKGFEIIKNYLKNSNPWTVRVGLVLMLQYYINEQYIDSVLKETQIINDDYYVLMANAWLISICYIKFPDKTLNLIKSKKLDKFTQNKAISKIRDSYRVDKVKKDSLLKYKID